MGRFDLALAGLLFVGCCVMAGCGSGPDVVVSEDKSAQNLQQIGAAYSLATVKNMRPPRDAADLIEAMKSVPGTADPATILRSPDDNEEYVIVYGVDFAQVAKARGNVDVILAYEKTGKGGKRHVLKPPAQIMVLTDEQFRAAAFPPGHTPAP